MLTRHDARAERVVACSIEARRLGIRVGMRAPDAQALAGQAATAFLPHDNVGDQRALVRLAIDCERFSPAVGIEEAEFPETIFLDVTGLDRLWEAAGTEGESRLTEAVAAWFRARKVRARLALASTIGLSWAATHYAAGDPSRCVVIDRVADAERFPVEALRLDEATIESLHALGIDTVGDLCRLPRESLRARFGEWLARRLDQLFGDLPEPLKPVRAEPPLVARWPFESPVGNGDVLAAVVRKLLGQVCVEMRRRNRGVLRVLVAYQLDTSAEQVERVVLRLFRPTASANELSELAELHASKLHFRSRIAAIEVLVGSTAPLESRQGTLFDNDTRDDPHEVALLVNRLASRVGFDRVLRVEKRTSVDPSRTYACLPATDQGVGRYSLTSDQATALRRLPLASYTGQPQLLSVDTDQHGTPSAVVWRGRQRVTRHWGPERVETGWWRRRKLRRDAYWVELENGSRLWLHHHLRTGQWLLAGECW